jgi:hypothetical protein
VAEVRRLTQRERRSLGVTPGFVARRYGTDGRALRCRYSLQNLTHVEKILPSASLTKLMSVGQMKPKPHERCDG